MDNPLKSLFNLNKNITFLNFGSFGACPKPIFEEYQKFQLELEQGPVQFITNTGVKYLENARVSLGNYINCPSQDVVFVTNPSYGVNAVAKSFVLNPGDEVLSTDLEYGACDRTWDYYCKKKGAKYLRQHIVLPILSKEHFIESFSKGITPKTKLIFISHITSTTALCLPVHEICALAKEKGIPCFIDGAHAPGQIPIDLQALDVDYYVGACHKWMMTPKGSAFLFVKKEFQNHIDPLVVSWGYDALFPSSSQFLDYHQFNGTRDFSAFLCIPKSIEFMQQYQWHDVAAQCRKLIKDNTLKFYEILDSSPHAPIDNEFMLQMCSAEIKSSEPEKLYRYIYDNYQIEIPVMRHDDRVYLRFSINAFNDQKDLDTLFDAIHDIKTTTQFFN
jgi:isopenicillin-N epimerase